MATGTSPGASASVFHDDDPEQTTEYRSLCVLALVGLILGLASPLCFGAPLLMVVPIAGIAVSLLALRQIAASEGALAGRWMAIVGLVLSIIFAIAPQARAFVIRTMRESQARSFGENWVTSLVGGNIDRSFRLTLDANRPTPPPEPGQPTKDRPSPFEAFKAKPQVAALMAAGKDAEVRFVETLNYAPQAFNRVYVRQRYDVIPKSGDAKPIDLVLIVQRAKLPNEGRSRWLVWSIEDPDKPVPMPQQY